MNPVFVVLISFLSACSAAAPAGTEGKQVGKEVEGSLVHDGLKREYLLHVPPYYEKGKPAPLILALHGGGGVGKKMNQNLTGGTLNRQADENGFLVVYPDGIGNRWNDGRDPKRTLRGEEGNADDLGFLRSLLDRLSAEYSVDPKRVFATGISNGGMMCYRLACEMSDRIAAVAPVAACMPQELLKSPEGGPVSVLICNGDEDPLMPFKGGEILLAGRSIGTVISAEETVRFWLTRNQCSQSPSVTELPDQDPKDGTRVEKKVYSGGKNRTEVVLYTVRGGGHTWPGGNLYAREKAIGRLSKDIDASATIFEFFKAHARN